MTELQTQLQNDYLLEHYRIERVLGEGGFGITYLAHDALLKQPVAIKEFLPVELAGRATDSVTVQPRSSTRDEYEFGLERFLSEAQLLARFKHPNIVRVTRFFEANGTAYLVMDYERGRSLSEYLKSHPGPVPQETLKSWFLPILKGLVEVHKAGFLHRDIKPGNIYLRDESEPLLIDFGAARQAIGEHSRSVTGIVSAGYAPTEQYGTDSKKQGPWTDLYALCATMYRCIAGKDPVDAPTRKDALFEGDDDPMPSAQSVGSGRYAPNLLALIDDLLQVSIKARPQQASAVLSVLKTGMDASGNTAGETAPNTPSDTQDNSASISDTRAVSEIERHEALAKEAEANEAIERYATGNTQHLTDVETAATDTGRALMAWALGAVGLVVLGAFGWLYQSNNDAALNGTLSLTVTPSDARITLPDSMPRYESGMELEPGDYRVLVRRNGYVSKSLSVTVRNGRHTTSQIELERVLVQRQVGEVFTDSLKSGGQGPEMVVLPTGSFQMGDLSGEGDDDEKPVHTVTIKNSIAVGKYEVTFADYDRFTLATGRSQVKDTRGFGRGRRPAINMTWDDALAYAKWLTTETGQRYRLPSESEWEYAARAGTQTRYSWGDEIGKNRANCDGCESRWDDEQTVPVGGFAPNAFGLHDMHGNVWEWVEDCYEDGYTGAPSDGSARRHCGGNYQPVLRGGSWMNKPVTLRSAHRSRLSPFLRGSSSGFRLVQDLDP